MSERTIALWLILAAGLIGRNHFVTVAAALLLLFSLTSQSRILPFLATNGIDIGVIIMIMAIMVPFATGSVETNDLLQTVTTVPGLLAIAVGILASCLAALGIGLLKARPEVMMGLVVGSIIGTAFFKGVPAGPLVAAGITALLFEFFR